MAEDNDLNAELATMILEDAGTTVTRASDGKEVVDLFKNHPRGTYDLILMDIMMPNMDGHQAAKAIRALSIERSDAVTIPIIALSANAFIDDIQESLDSGMNDHISKPINMEELIDTITKYIKHDQENKEVNSDFPVPFQNLLCLLWKIWSKLRATDPEYALAMKNADTAKVWQLENLFELQAEEIATQTCLVMQSFLISYQKKQNSFGLVLAKRVLFFTP